MLTRQQPLRDLFGSPVTIELLTALAQSGAVSLVLSINSGIAPQPVGGCPFDTDL